jgi:glyoxylase-like metal-dependent hydrolase (beta-lactamase superfamily II)
VPARFRRYDATRGLNAEINRVQFGVAEVEWPERFPWPDVTYEGAMSFTLGGERFELRHALGETDDATWVWAPYRKVVCTGDLFNAMAGLAPEVIQIRLNPNRRHQVATSIGSGLREAPRRGCRAFEHHRRCPGSRARGARATPSP